MSISQKKIEEDFVKIVSWNCCWQKNGFTSEKRDLIFMMNPDILIIQECKQDDWEKLDYSDKNGDWYSDSKESRGNPDWDHGIGIFCKNDFTIDKSLFNREDLSNMRYSLPYIIKIEGKEIMTLFSVWTKPGYKNYHVPVYNSLDYFYEKINSPIVFIGDFNTGSMQGSSNAHWYEELKKHFGEKKIYNCADAQEWIPTFYRGNGSWLDDHCFASVEMKTISFGIGNHDYWQKYSDHCPIMVEFEI